MTEIVKADIPAPADDVVVLARNPEEMAMAQQGLVSWAQSRVQAETRELEVAEENLTHAKSMKVRTDGWKRQVAMSRKRVTYYTKILSALEEGFCIIPNFPIQVIASRTSKESPKKQTVSRAWEIDTVKYESLPQGEGRYVDPRPKTRQVVRQDGDKEITRTVTTDFQEDIDFPFKKVRPQVLTDMDRAMKLKIFDEIGVLPDVSRRKGDPMVVGQIKYRDGYNETVVSFLVTWWIDTRDL
jgi:hypothetical protein